MLQTISFESWQFNMWDMADAERISSAWYFAALLVVGAYFLLNVFIAGISSVFLRLRRENQVHKGPQFVSALPCFPACLPASGSGALLMYFAHIWVIAGPHTPKHGRPEVA